MTTLATLRSLVRQRANMENSTFVSDSELTGYINAAGAELHDIFVTRYEDYFTTSTTSTVASGANTIAFPATMLKLRGIDRVDGATSIRLRPFAFEDRTRYINGASIYPRYRILNQTITLYPAAAAPGTYTLWFVKAYVPLVGDSDVLIADIGDRQVWYEFVVVDAAIRCLQKEESDVSVLAGQKMGLLDRIKRAASDVDVSEPARVVETDSDYAIDEDLAFLYFPR